MKILPVNLLPLLKIPCKDNSLQLSLEPLHLILIGIFISVDLWNGVANLSRKMHNVYRLLTRLFP